MRRESSVRRVLTVAAVVVAGGLLLAACAAGANPSQGVAMGDTDPAVGFWYGLWHGLIIPVTFVVSLFNDNVSIYEVHNTGNWYDLGFLLGIACVLGGGGAGSRR
ncbi:hypothetical protein Xcel_1117 [Xylanimonas cellulosilytica DSM 15894]|uniref:Lipoprotein n=1 Tax=Xylanimonas cellulosilytica (strain DSM 15894 / JCM 12276 / CECT 5975 / KCTC 9989 / LMG 20990 / NBRC 107835 / XIL07) TaxID=446471 RepID=D1BZJ4_XYLCX|nr:hypothetical protein [Xylanimonas cellulosilytica]ACZ30148.1 hypothetical protein Xcel_1117 [Xylanimonas cellulosilytica DSM 15894]